MFTANQSHRPTLAADFANAYTHFTTKTVGLHSPHVSPMPTLTADITYQHHKPTLALQFTNANQHFNWPTLAAHCTNGLYTVGLHITNQHHRPTTLAVHFPNAYTYCTHHTNHHHRPTLTIHFTDTYSLQTSTNTIGLYTLFISLMPTHCRHH